MDIRAFGKGYDQFYQNAKAMGIEFQKGKVAKITEDDDQNPVVRVELVDEGSKIVDRTHDLAVLSVGMLPDYDPTPVFKVQKDSYGFVASPSPNLSSTTTDQAGIFAAGAATGPMDIVDSIASASAAASSAAAYLTSVRNGH
jgi:heterodisulfide reductase subunit A